MISLIIRDSNCSLSVSESVFGYKFNEPLIHQVINYYINNSHCGSKSQKTRSEVSGSGRKPWKQKGTGRSRAGSLRSPIWRGGGVTFASRPKVRLSKINKKMYWGAVKSILSELVRNKRLIVVSDFFVDSFKTSSLIKKLKSISLDKKILVFVNQLTNNLLLASRNLHFIKICVFKSINPVDLLFFDTIIMTVDIIRKIEEFYCDKKRKII